MMRQEHRAPWIILGVLLLIVLLGPLLMGGMMGSGLMGPGMMWGFGAPGNPPGNPPGGWHWGWGLMMGLGWLMMLAFWGALIVGVALLVRWLSGATAGATAPARESPLDILKRRYAAGEITQDEYARIRQEIERS